MQIHLILIEAFYRDLTKMSQGRLPSFRSPRDLTLGAKNNAKKPIKSAGLTKSLWPESDKKKKFTPNLNPQRKEARNASPSTDSTKQKAQKSGWNASDKSSKSDFSKKFAKPELIQVSGGIFSDGIGNDSGLRKSGWGSRGEGSGDRESNQLERPKLELNAKYDKKQEEEKLRKLLRDDFIDDLKTGHLVPVQLPMVNTGKMFEETKGLKIKSEKSDEISKTFRPKSNRILDSDDEEDPVISDKPNEVATKQTSLDEADLTLQDLMQDKHSELLFFQMPDHLPATKPADKESNVCLGGLNEGFLGKLEFRKSGKVQLNVNNVLFDVDIGTQVGFLQELYSVTTPKEAYNSISKGNMTNLGRVRNRVVTMPAWNALLQSDEADQESSSDDESDEN